MTDTARVKRPIRFPFKPQLTASSLGDDEFKGGKNICFTGGLIAVFQSNPGKFCHSQQVRCDSYQARIGSAHFRAMLNRIPGADGKGVFMSAVALGDVPYLKRAIGAYILGAPRSWRMLGHTRFPC
jgi:hypothetical protein